MINKKRISLILIALVPALVYIALLSFSIIFSHYPIFSSSDLLILSIVVVYLFCLFILRNSEEGLARLVLFTYSVIIVITLSEFILRLTSPSDYMPWNPMQNITSYAADGVMPGIEGEINLTINKYGLRGPDIDINKADIKILVIGGSTAECFYVTDELTWPWRLQDKLTEGSGKKVFVGSSGRSGYFTANHIYLLENYKLMPEFDLIIMLSGINDMGTFLRKNYEERKGKIFISQRKMFYKKWRLYYKLKKLFFIYFSRDVIVQDPQGLWYKNIRKMRKEALKYHTTPEGLEQAINIYKDNLRQIIKICKERNQKLVMLTQPSLYQKDIPPHLESLLWETINGKEAYSTEILAETLKAYNSAMLEVCAEEKIDCIDLDSKLPKDTTIFYDDCHFNVSGCESVSEILANEIPALMREGK